jgi:hypothetical protein
MSFFHEGMPLISVEALMTWMASLCVFNTILLSVSAYLYDGIYISSLLFFLLFDGVQHFCSCVFFWPSLGLA